MLRQPTIQDWLEPESGRLTADLWRALGSMGEVPMLTAAMECARRGDAKSLISLFEHLARDGHGPEVEVGARFDVPTTVPDYGDIGEAGWSNKSAPLPTSVVNWKMASFEVAVAVCLARHRIDGAPQLPCSKEEDFLDTAPYPKEPFTEDERGLLVAAIKVFKEVSAHGTAIPSGVTRLFFEIAGRVDTAETGQVFLAEGLAVDEFVGAKRPDDRGVIMSAHRHAMSRGCISAAHAICEMATQGQALKTYNYDQLNAFTAPDNKTDLDFGKLVESLRGDDESEDLLLSSPRFGRLMRMAERLVGNTSISLHDRLGFGLRLIELHMQSAAKFSRPWCDAVVEPIVAQLRKDDPAPGDVAKIVNRMIDFDRHKVTDWFGVLMKSQCAPMIEFLKPALPRLLEDGAANYEMTECFRDLGETKAWSITKGPDRLRRSVEVLEAVGAAPLQPFERAKRTSESNPIVGQTTLLHTLARNPRPNQIEAMLVLVALGADPLAPDSTGKVAGAGNDDWEAAWRSHRAREAAMAALGGLDDMRALVPR